MSFGYWGLYVGFGGLQTRSYIRIWKMLFGNGEAGWGSYT